MIASPHQGKRSSTRHFSLKVLRFIGILRLTRLMGVDKALRACTPNKQNGTETNGDDSTHGTTIAELNRNVTQIP
jgi:hypothetical protein